MRRVFACLLVLTVPTLLWSFELSTSDRVAMLYSPQLRFSVEGDPLITIGLVEAQTSIEFTPESSMRVLPLGEGGPEITLPGNTTYQVSLIEGEAGEYMYWATVARLRWSDRDQLDDLQTLWSGRGFETQTIDLGSFFAVRGNTFDNRLMLLVVGGSSSQEEAQALVEQLESDFGVISELHTELVQHPTGELQLTSEDLEITINHRDLLWIATSEDTNFEVFADGFGDESRHYVGSLIFTLDRNGQLVLVNEIPIERLLEGILPAEIYASAPMDALSAQAVAARSELLAALGTRYLADPYMTCATQRCQVYAGTQSEHTRTTEAVENTRGWVLMDDGQIARTPYSASSGGYSGDYQSTWGHQSIGYLTGQFNGEDVPPEFAAGLDESNIREFLTSEVDTFDNIEDFGGTRTHRWTADFDVAELTSAVNERYDVGTVEEIEALERDNSGRVVQLFISGSDGDVVVERELPIRRALGGLRSALFVIDYEWDEDGSLVAVHLIGGGFGHGVGLCQTGAIGAAQRGFDFTEILSHYYPDTDLTQLWE